MQLRVINTGYFKLDGGAMFGVVPKSLWQRTNPSDEKNLCTWAMRSLLIEDGDQLILIDNGIGNKQDAKFFSHYYLNGNDSLDGNEISKMYTDELNPSIKAKFTFLLGAASVEYVMPLLQDLEISSGALLGLGRVAMGIEQTSANPRWKQVFSNAYGTMSETGDTLFYSVTTNEFDNPDIRPGAVSGVLKDVSSAFFNFQPYVAVKWQFLERLGLRISVGFNKGTVRQGSWKLNGRTQIGDSPSSALSGVTFRTMLYVGL